MFHMPMSSPMMTTMLGFCDCCAKAGKLVVAKRIVEASAAGIIRLIVMGLHPFRFKISDNTRHETDGAPAAERQIKQYQRKTSLCSFGKEKNTDAVPVGG